MSKLFGLISCLEMCFISVFLSLWLWDLVVKVFCVVNSKSSYICEVG